MSEVEKILEQEKSIFNFEALINFVFRRRKIIIFSSSLMFSILFINTIYSYIKRPVYKGSFSILIQDPIDDRAKINSLQARLALNEYSYNLPTLIQYLKSDLVLQPLAKDLGISNSYLKNNISIKLDGQKSIVSRGILKISLLGNSQVRNMVIMRKLSQRYLDAASEQRKLKLNSGLDFLNSEMPKIELKVDLIKKRIEEFRIQNNIIEPILRARNIESQKFEADLKINNFSSNVRRLNLIKDDIKSNQFRISGFVEQLSQLGFNLISSDVEAFNKYLALEGELAEAKTKYKSNSKVLLNLEQRLESLYPEIQEKQLANIELAIKLNNSKIELEKKKLKEISERFRSQPNLLSEYEKLLSDLKIAESNFTSLINAKENFRLELAQKSLPWLVIEKPKVFPKPISPNVSEESIRNFLLSLLFGFSLAYLREITDSVFHNDIDIEKILNPLNLPLLGSLPYIKDLKKENDKDIEKDKLNQFQILESFRNLATSIRFLNISDQETKIFLITSTKQGEGKTTITSLLAKTFVELGKKVLLVDADMRRPSLNKFFETDNIIGLSNLITDNKVTLKNIVQKTAFNNLDIITAGIRPPDPVFLFSSEKMKSILKEFKNENYDLILFDAPPSQGLADALLLSEFSDLIIYVVNVEDTNKNDFRKTINKFYKKGKYALGCVSNRSQIVDFNYGNYSYNYYYNKNLYKYVDSGDNLETENNEFKEGKSFKFSYGDFINKFKKGYIKKIFQRFMKWLDF